MGTQKKRNKQKNIEIEFDRQTPKVPQKRTSYQFDEAKKHASNNVTEIIKAFIYACAVIAGFILAAFIVSLTPEERTIYTKLLGKWWQERLDSFIFGWGIGLATAKFGPKILALITGKTSST